MKNFLIAFSVFMMWAVLGMWYYSCILKEVCEDDIIAEEQVTEDKKPISEDVSEPENDAPKNAAELKKIITTDSLNIIDSELNNLFSYPLAPEIRINSPQVEIPQTTSIFVADLVEYLEEHPQTHLVVYGAYDENEFSSTSIENHGLTRAAHVKDLLVEEGISATRINLKALKVDLNFLQNEVFQGGILLQVIDPNEMKGDTSEERENLLNKTLYAKFDQESFVSTKEIDEYVSELKSYLENNPEKRITITGHTDDIGEAEANEWIGMERAKSVRDYLKAQGIPEFKMQTLTEGETEPIVANNSWENRAKNRRIEIEIN